MTELIHQNMHDMPRHSASSAAELCLQTTQLSYRYQREPVLRDVSLQLARGEMLGIIGPNGAGKSSLLKILAGLLQPGAGQVSLHGNALTSYHLRDLAQQRSYLAQSAPMHWPLAVANVVALGRLPHGDAQRLNAADTKAIEEAMQWAEVSNLRERRITSLSEGERMRVMFARMLATGAPLMLADEPTAALDLYHQHHTLSLFRAHCQRGGSAALVLHDLNLAARYCDRLLLLDRGQVLAQGTPAEVLTADLLSAAYRVEVQVALSNGIPQITVLPLRQFSN